MIPIIFLLLAICAIGSAIWMNNNLNEFMKHVDKEKAVNQASIEQQKMKIIGAIVFGIIFLYGAVHGYLSL